MTDKEKWQKSRDTGDRARSACRWEEAIRCYTDALAAPKPSSQLMAGLDPHNEWELLSSRAHCLERIGRYGRSIEDLEQMTRIAAALGDVEKQLESRTRLSYALSYHRDPEKAKTVATQALSDSRDLGLDYYTARSIYGLGLAEVESGSYPRAAELLAEARHTFSILGKAEDEAWCLYNLAYCASNSGYDPIPLAEEMQNLVHPLNNRLLEARALHMLSIAYKNEPARRRHYQEASLELYLRIDERDAIAAMLHNLGVFYFDQGVSKRGFEFFKRSIGFRDPEDTRLTFLLTHHVASLSGYISGEDPDEMLDWNLRTIDKAVENGVKNVSSLAASARGWMLTQLGRHAEAEAWLLRAEKMLATSPGYLPMNFAFLSQTYVAMGKIKEALRASEEGLDRAYEQSGAINMQSILWARYCAMRASNSVPEIVAETEWELLSRAASWVLKTAGKVEDPGLRRNYLIRGLDNKEPLIEWARQTFRRGESLDSLYPGTAETEELRDPFKRLVEFGSRLTSQRSLEKLPEFIMDEFVELSGAERALIALYDPDSGELSIIRTLDFANGSGGKALAEHADAISQAALSRQPVLLDSVGSVPEGEPPPVHLRSVLVLPLVQADRALGMILAEVREVFGAFTRADADLLSVLANQAAAAFENARWSEGLEHLVAERTEQLSRRNSELEIINGIQQGLAAELDIEGVYKVVGDKLVEVFDAQSVLISTYDLEAGARISMYNFEKGVHFEKRSHRINELHRKLIEQRSPLVFNTNTMEQLDALGAVTVPGTDEPQSAVFVPLLAGDRVFGTISLQNVDRENAFSDAEVRLLSTLAGSMSVALENARLFDETQRLLGETESRNAELAVINSVQEGLAEQVEFNRLIELVGEKIRQVFDAQGIGISLYDRERETIDFPYYVDDDQRLGLEPQPLGTGFTAHVIHTARPLLVNSDLPEKMEELGSIWIKPPEDAQETRYAQAYLGVPIMLGGQVGGVISLTNYERENAYSKNDVNLLSTLANSLSVALENARLFEETTRRANEMAALADIGREISSTLEQSIVLERIATQARDLLKARDVVIRLLGSDRETLEAVVALGPYAEQYRASATRLGEGMTGDIALTGVGEIINNPSKDHRARHVPGTPEPETDPDVIMIVPLQSGGEVIGTMGLWRPRETGIFTTADLALLESLARQAAIAILNAQLYEETQRQKQYSEALLENSPVAIVTTNLDAIVVSWNPAAVRLFGYESDEAVGRNLDTLIAADGDLMEEAVEFSRITAKEVRINTVTQRTRKDGTRVDVELLALPVVLDGEHVGIIAIYHDITDLLKAREEAESANEAKSAFLATMSHEIRTPMNAIIGMSGLLMDTELTAEQHEFADVIRTSGDALLAIINDILDFSKIEAGRMDLEEEPIDLRELLESSIDLIRIPASRKGLDLAYEMDADVPPAILGDATRLRQVLINLLNNAVKFTESGEVVLKVESSKLNKATADANLQPSTFNAETSTLHFSVRDTGIGIPEDRVDRLFQAFSQVDASTSRRYGGTGLGLAISRSLAMLMGGHMWVESVEGEGSTFHFTIRAEPALELETREQLSGEQPALAGKRLLIVDDNPTNRRILTLQTKTWGMLARDTDSPAEAIKWLERGDPFDLAIIDMHMPGMEGSELAGRIKALPDREALPLILFSSLSGRELTLENSPFVDHLQKPLKQSLLFDVLMNVFSTAQVSGRRSSVRAEIDGELAERLPLRILLTEDNAVNQKVALRILERMGFRADVAANGVEALDAVRRQLYDVILMDVQMPEMDGLEATRKIRQLAGTNDSSAGLAIRIIAMTANATEEDRKACYDAGMDDYIAKPIRVEELAEALKRSRPE